MSTCALKPISQHCYDLTEALGAIEPYDRTFRVNEWLRIAAAVKSVDIDWTRFDESFGWCSGADNYEIAREVILRGFVTNLTVFTYTWGALEAAIEVTLGKTKRGNIKRACHYISTYFRRHLMITPYPELVSEFCVLASKSSSYGELVDEIKAQNEVATEGLGLFAVYKFRNEFAHGDMVFPVPDNEHRPISDAPNLIECATRIVLLSIQMLALVDCAAKGFRIGRPRSEDDSQIPLTEWLRILHFVEAEPEDNLLSALGKPALD